MAGAPLPRIPADEFEALQVRLVGEDQKLVATWYRRDDNAVPPEYRLKPRDPNGEYANEQKWRAVEERLYAALAAAAERSTLPPARRLVYQASATEQEIAALIIVTTSHLKKGILVPARGGGEI